MSVPPPDNDRASRAELLSVAAGPSAPVRYLVVHEDGPTVLAIKRSLEIGSATAIGARTGPAGIERLRASAEPYHAILLHWTMPDYQALEFLWELSQLDLNPDPWVIAFAGNWPEDDLSRALQLGVHSFFGTPLRPSAVHREVETLRTTGQSPTRKHLLVQAGARLLEPSDKLWQLVGDPQWRARMQSLADGRRRSSGTSLVGRMLSAVDQAAGYPIGIGVASALLDLAQTEDGDLRAQAARLCVRLPIGATRLTRLFHAAMSVAAPGNPNARQTAGLARNLEHLVELVRRRADEVRYSARFLALREAAVAVIREDAAPHSDAAGRFVERLARVLTVAPDFINHMQLRQLLYIAAVLVDEVSEARALDLARLCLLAHTMRATAQSLNREELQHVGTLLGCGEDPDQDRIARLIRAASATDDDPPFEALREVSPDTLNRRLAELAAQGDTGATNPVEIARRAGQLCQAAAPAQGQIAQRRLEDLLDQIETGQSAALPAPTRRELAATLALPRRARTPDAAEIWQALGVTDPERERKIADVLNRIPPGVEFTTDDLRKLAAIADRLGESVPTPEEQDLVASLMGRRPTPDRLARAREHADLIGFLDSLGLPAGAIDRDQLADLSHLTPAVHADLTALTDEQRRRLQLLAHVLRNPGRESIDQIIKRFIDGNGSDPAMLQGLIRLLDSPDDRAILDRVQHALGLNPDDEAGSSADIDALLAKGQLAGAQLSVHRMPDDDPRTVPMINKLALALHEAGRTREGADLYARALSLQPKRLNLRLNLARLRVELGQFPEARVLLEEVRARTPGFGDTDALIAICERNGY